MLDMKADGFGVVPMPYHATAVHANPLTDNLYLVLDEDDEPLTAYLPVPSTAPTVDGTTIYTFNAVNGDGHMVYQWRGKLNLLPYIACFSYFQVKALDFTNVLVRIYADGDLIFEEAITSKEPGTLPLLDGYDSCEIEILGTSRVYEVQLAEDINEFD